MSVTKLLSVRGKRLPPRPRAEERAEHRGRRKFASGALDQAASILGSMSSSVFVLGLIVPYFAAFSGVSMMRASALLTEAMSALALSLATTVAAVTLKGLARREEDDGRAYAKSADSLQAGDD